MSRQVFHNTGSVYSGQGNNTTSNYNGAVTTQEVSNVSGGNNIFQGTNNRQDNRNSSINVSGNSSQIGNIGSNNRNSASASQVFAAPPKPPPYSIYRASSLGQSLFAALNQMKEEQELDQNQINQAMLIFDQVMSDALETRVNNKINIRGSLDVYRHCDNIWTLILRRASLMSSEELIVTDAIKIVAPQHRR